LSGRWLPQPSRALIAAVLAALLFVLIAAPAPARASNGCGPAGFGFLVPDRPFGFDFTVACERHDDCYTAPWRDRAASRDGAKLDCDTGFLADLDDACLQAAVGGARHLGLCLQLALDYHRAVRSWLGELAYARAQL
jgi:hypothetical protein